MTEETAEESLQRLEQIGCSERLPASNEEAAKAEELLAEEMSKLSMSEQDIVSFEVHGIAAEVEGVTRIEKCRVHMISNVN